ncbi:MAG TPA: peptide-methionine (S)-S-oxide reductase MsrA, partial [Candidatus Thermoplasmatota archaeon]|nr:peptide-methionine (S)-S-oxide reductase MsrA [Candidatus Thermoplasmatota archaeon]
AEVVQVLFDPQAIGFRDVLEIFFSIHDPTTVDRQGGDVGPQYRSIVLYGSSRQRDIAHEVIADLEKQAIYGAPVVTEVKPLATFYPAEDYHQRYFEGNPNQPYCRAVVAPKVAKFRKRWKHRLKGSRAA